MTSVEATVRALLDTAGITCSETEFATFVEDYVKLRQRVEAMYAPAFSGVDPMLVLASDR